MFSIIALTLAVIFLFVIGWHIIFPVLIGGAIVLTASIWFVVIASILAFCVGILFLFLFSGGGILLLAGIFLLWAIIAIVLFPILFPILFPLLIVFLVLSYFRRKRRLGSPSAPSNNDRIP